MSNYSRLIEIFEKLIGFRTITGDLGAASACLDYCESILKPHNLHINRYSSNGYPSMVVTSQVTKAPSLLLAAHLDVLPAAGDMFTLNGVGSKLVGRGTYDMKFAAACYLYLVEELGSRCADFDFGIMFTLDEETDGLNGTEYLLSQGFGAGVCLLPDGGDNWHVEAAAKGLWRVRVDSKGKSTHASRPWTGKNPILNLAAFLTAAEKLSTADADSNTVVPTLFSAGSEVALNQIPDTAVGALDIRFISKPDLEKLKTDIEKLAKKYHVKVSTALMGEHLEHNTKLPVFKQWQQVVKEVRSVKSVGFMRSIAASDARFFTRRNIPILITQPKGGGRHGPDEWIDESELYEFYECIKQYLERVALPAQTTA